VQREYQFEIALSFAGEDRLFVDQVANLLNDAGVRVFYDKFEEASLWGKNLYDYLSDVYQNKALYTIMFISSAYATKVWPNHERQSMQARAFQESEEYILPARFDDTEIPGILPTTGYVSLAGRSPEDFVRLIKQKLVEGGRTIPSESARSAVLSVESAPRVDETHARITVVDADGLAVVGAHVTALAGNNTAKDARTNDEGVADLFFPTRRQLTLLIAHAGSRGSVVRDWDPAEDLRVLLPASENVGSIVCHGTCHVPGLNGRLNLILDTHMRMYLYADNIAIRDGEQQPASFEIGVPIKVEDADGVVMQLTVVHIQGRTSLLRYVYRRP
jgi:hypothetical protein